MLALAAYQRGLTVRFYDNFLHLPRFSDLPWQGLHGELFSISDGIKTVHFQRSLTDSVRYELAARCDDKQFAKTALDLAEVNVAPGLVVRTGDEPEIQDLLHRYRGQTFLLKPLVGSLGKGVVRNISENRLHDELNRINGEPHLLEVFLKGREFRLVVLNERVIMAREQLAAHVVGNGKDTIEQLIENCNQQRASHPIYRFSLIRIEESVAPILNQQGLTLNCIAPEGLTVWLSSFPDYLNGGLTREIRADELTEKMRWSAIAAAQAIPIGFAGLDLIVLNHGLPDETVFVLELNVCPYLIDVLGDFPLERNPVFNRVAEALVDEYFPESISQPRHTRASFDLASVVHLLMSGAAAFVELPTLRANWLHARHKLNGHQLEQKVLSGLVAKTRQAGLHSRFIQMVDGSILVDTVLRESDQGKLNRILGII